MISRNVSRSKPDLEAQLTSRDQLLPSRLNLPTMRNRNRYIRKITMNNAVKIGFAIVFSIICTDKYSEVLPTGAYFEVLLKRDLPNQTPIPNNRGQLFAGNECRGFSGSVMDGWQCAMGGTNCSFQGCPVATCRNGTLVRTGRCGANDGPCPFPCP